MHGENLKLNKIKLKLFVNWFNTC